MQATLSETKQKALFSRAKWIAESAYFKAEARCFLLGFELEDWLQAEQEFYKEKIKDFLLISREDGGITLAGLQNLAEIMGIHEPENEDSELILIHLIQRSCKDKPCFRVSHDGYCHHSSECLWRDECWKLIAEYQR